MSSAEFVFSSPDRVVIGTIGQPGERAFYLQARQGNLVCSVLLEKQQAAILADALEELIEEHSTGVRPPVSTDNRPLDVPLTEEFRVYRLGLGWSVRENGIWIEVWSEPQDSAGEDDIDAENAADVMRIFLTEAYVGEFIRRTRAVVAAGRQACPVCEQPMGAAGHICPRANGYHRLGAR